MEQFKNLELVKFPEVDEVDKSILVNNFERFFSKFDLNDSDKLTINVKDYAKGGLRRQHEVKAHFLLSGEVFVASHTDWQLIETIQNVLKKLGKEVQKSTSK
jgi:ribosome-associated translation inhibitor RaiA